MTLVEKLKMMCGSRYMILFETVRLRRASLVNQIDKFTRKRKHLRMLCSNGIDGNLLGIKKNAFWKYTHTHIQHVTGSTRTYTERERKKIALVIDRSISSSEKEKKQNNLICLFLSHALHKESNIWFKLYLKASQRN